ncbi:unnamed protein product, partial [Chrysoparadoxa australica]
SVGQRRGRDSSAAIVTGISSLSRGIGWDADAQYSQEGAAGAAPTTAAPRVGREEGPGEGDDCAGAALAIGVGVGLGRPGEATGSGNKPERRGSTLMMPSQDCSEDYDKSPQLQPYRCQGVVEEELEPPSLSPLPTPHQNERNQWAVSRAEKAKLAIMQSYLESAASHMISTRAVAASETGIGISSNADALGTTVAGDNNSDGDAAVEVVASIDVKEGGTGNSVSAWTAGDGEPAFA